jgi:Protein of unknown function (DUF3108)
MLTLQLRRNQLRYKGPISWVRRQKPRKKPKLRLGPRRWVNWGHGEQMTYTVRLAGVEGGRAAISVGRPKQSKGRRTLQLRGLGETVPFISTFSKMSEEVLTTIDLAGMTPLLSKADRKASGKRKDRYIETLYVPSSFKVAQQIKRRGRVARRTRRINRPLHDGISALYALRSLRWPLGASRTFLVLAGNSLYRVELRAAAKERLYTKLGARDTVRLDGIARRIFDNMQLIKRKRPRSLSIWLTSDAARIPVKVVGQTLIGPIEASISSYVPPRRRTRVRVARAPRLPALPPDARPAPVGPRHRPKGPPRPTKAESSAPARGAEGAPSQGHSVFGTRR